MGKDGRQALKKSYHLNDPNLEIILYEYVPGLHESGWDTISYGISESPFGEFFIAVSEYGLINLQLTCGDSESIISNFRNRYRNAWLCRDDYSAHLLAEKLLNNDFESPVRVNVRGTQFQLRVWSALMDIPFGETVTYSELASRIGMPKAARAVASAVGKNYISYFIPCHRVVRNDGTLGGFRWGTDCKEAMINWEKERKQQFGTR